MTLNKGDDEIHFDSSGDDQDGLDSDEEFSKSHLKATDADSYNYQDSPISNVARSVCKVRIPHFDTLYYHLD